MDNAVDLVQRMFEYSSLGIRACWSGLQADRKAQRQVFKGGHYNYYNKGLTTQLTRLYTLKAKETASITRFAWLLRDGGTVKFSEWVSSRVPIIGAATLKLAFGLQKRKRRLLMVNRTMVSYCVHAIVPVSFPHPFYKCPISEELLSVPETVSQSERSLYVLDLWSSRCNQEAMADEEK